MPILSWQINYSSTFASFFIVMTHNSPVNFNLKHFLLWVKGSHENPNFQNFECSGENLPNSSWHFWKHKSVFFEILQQYPVPSNIIPCKFLRFLSARVKIRQIPRVNFELTSQFLFKFCNILQSWHISNLYILSSYIFYVGQILHYYSVSWKITLFYFFRSCVVYFAQKGPIKVQMFEAFEYLDQNSPNSCHFWNKKLIFLQILYHT